LLELKDEYDNTPQMWGIEWKRKMIQAVRGEVCEEKQQQLDTLVQMLDMMELVKSMNTEHTEVG